MKSEDLRNVSVSLKKAGNIYKKIENILSVSRYVVKNLVTYKCKKQTKKRGRKQKISKAASISIKREISYLQLKEEKINCSKLKENCGLKVSISTYAYFKSYIQKGLPRNSVVTEVQEKENRTHN